MPNQSDQIKGFREKILKIDKYLESLIKSEKASDIVAACMEELYKIIMTIGECAARPYTAGPGQAPTNPRLLIIVFP